MHVPFFNPSFLNEKMTKTYFYEKIALMHVIGLKNIIFLNLWQLSS